MKHNRPDLDPDKLDRTRFLIYREAVYGSVQRIADSWTNPPGTVGDVLNRLEGDGLVEAAALLRSPN